MDPKKELTAFAVNAGTGTDLIALLGEAGLELWQAPEGFWAIRVKPAAVAASADVAKASRRRRARSAG